MKGISSGKVLKIFVMGKNFGGLQSIELANWSGKGFLGTRDNFDFCNTRKELSKTGIYLLINSDQNEDGSFQIYVGETDSFSQRIIRHAKTKDWWDKFIVFTSGNESLTKAHAKYLEKKLFDLLSETDNSVEIMNSASPTGANLSESDISYLEEFLHKMLFVLETLGYPYFKKEDAPIKNAHQGKNSDIDNDRFFITHKIKISLNDDSPAKAYMVLKNNKWIVEKGSYINLSPSERFILNHRHFKKWEHLVNSGKVVKSEIEGLGIIQEEIEFKNASVAATVVRAIPTARIKWIHSESGKNLKEYLISRTYANVA